MAETEAEIARQLARQAGREAELSALQPLAGGRNNRVFRVMLADGWSAALKIYFVHPNDPRDRLAAEWNFLNHVWSFGVRSVPQPLAVDRTAHAALLAFVPGRPLSDGEIAQRHVQAAVDFVVATNAQRAGALPPASEACFSLAQHLETIERRVRALDNVDPQAPSSAQGFVQEELWPAWWAVKARLEGSAAEAGLPVDAELGESEVIASPSDFGFHNAIAGDDGELTFIDFEYAGRDDPAKLVCDFLSQPRIPTPHALRAGFMRRLAEGLSAPWLVARAELLLDAYRIKWICIILNELLPVGAARRAFATNAARDERCAVQLATARARLAEITF